jgi:hypothetical protein
MSPPRSPQTLLLEPFDPHDLDACVHQPLRAVALDKIVRFPDADDAALDLRSNKCIRTWRKPRHTDGAWLKSRVAIGVREELRDVLRWEGRKLRGCKSARLGERVSFGVCVPWELAGVACGEDERC